jgi:hypothetical protein
MEMEERDELRRRGGKERKRREGGRRGKGRSNFL